MGNSKKMSKEEVLELLKNGYIGAKVNFSGNDEISAFYARIVNFKLNIDRSISVIIADKDENSFEINWSEIKNNEFDNDIIIRT